MIRRILAMASFLVLGLAILITAYAGTSGISYNVTIPPFGKRQILCDTKSEPSSYDYFCIKLTGGTASSIIGSSDMGGSMKIYKNQGYGKIYYSTVPPTNSTVHLYAGLTSPANQTASGKSYCN